MQVMKIRDIYNMKHVQNGLLHSEIYQIFLMNLIYEELNGISLLHSIWFPGSIPYFHIRVSIS